MVYQSFLTTVTETLQEELGNLYQLSIQKVTKNNGTVLDGLCISKENEHIFPTIYLNPYYEHYQNGMPMEDILGEIMDLYRNRAHMPSITSEQLTSFSQFQDKVIFRLIHTSSNESLLASVPHIPFLDLSIIFCLFLEEQDSCQMTAMIHNQLADSWGATAESLYPLACKNTPRLLPVNLKEMRQLLFSFHTEQFEDPDLRAFMEDMMKEPISMPLYVLSNAACLYGASAMLYPDVLKNFAESLGQDLIILPSSVHEVLLLPSEEETDFQELSEMVCQINLAEVPPEDRLSHNVYLYSRAKSDVFIVSSCSALLS